MGSRSLLLLLVLGIPMVTSGSPSTYAGFTGWGFSVVPEYLTFSMSSMYVGDRFNVTIFMSTVSGGMNTHAWQCRVSFDLSQIQAVRANFTGGGQSLFFVGHESVSNGSIIDNTNGTVECNETLLGSDFVPPDTNSLFWIEFEIAALPPVGGMLHSLISFDPANSSILDPNLNPAEGLSYEPANYYYDWALIMPYLEVAPNLRVFDEHHHWTGACFTENVTIMHLLDGWFLSNVTFHLLYNASVLALINVTLDPLWSSGIYTNCTGDVGIQVGNPSQNPAGDTVAANLTFVILPPGSLYTPLGWHDDSPLELNNVTVGSSVGFQITPGIIDGLIQVYSYSVDLNGDGTVDMKDIAYVARRFMCTPSDPLWDPTPDMNGDDKIDMKDISTIARHFMEHYP
jgi:hypothetical protein